MPIPFRMGALFEVVMQMAFQIACVGVKRAWRTPHPILRVRATYWLSAAVVAVAAQVVVVAALAWKLGRALMLSLSDDMFLFLWLILLPIAVVGIAVCVAIIGWLIGVARRTLAMDGLARIELAVAGVGGVMCGGYILATVWSNWAALLVGASLVSLGAAIVPAAWREAHVAYPYVA